MTRSAALVPLQRNGLSRLAYTQDIQLGLGGVQEKELIMGGLVAADIRWEPPHPPVDMLNVRCNERNHGLTSPRLAPPCDKMRSSLPTHALEEPSPC